MIYAKYLKAIERIKELEAELVKAKAKAVPKTGTRRRTKSEDARH